MFVDLELGRLLERAEGASCSDYVEARARLFPEVGATWIDVAGTYAMFDGVGSPITQSFGLGMFEPATDQNLDTLESFFRERGSGPYHEVSPLAGKDLAVKLSARGYEPFEFTSVMFLPLGTPRQKRPPKPQLQVRIATPEDEDVWVQTAVKGWSEFEEYRDLMTELSRVGFARARAVSFLAEWKDQPVATGALSVEGEVALLAGASTIPEARKQGAQGALLDARLQFAESAGCRLAMMCAEPGSTSQRNAEREGFRIAYTRAKWRLRGTD